MSNRYGNRSRIIQNSRESSSPPSATPTQNVTEPSLAMVYGISQQWRSINDRECGFERGTIFDELDKPFCDCSRTNR